LAGVKSPSKTMVSAGNASPLSNAFQPPLAKVPNGLFTLIVLGA
jgi:hypothetical protein